MDYTREELGKWLEDKGIRSFRANQIFKWTYLKLAADFEEMTDLGKPLRKALTENFTLTSLELVEKQVSSDTTEKFLFRLADGECIESVLIPEKDHFTLCVSSQAGCAMDCRFCLTARGGVKRDLTKGERPAQSHHERRQGRSKGREPLKLPNKGCKGKGEPLAK